MPGQVTLYNFGILITAKNMATVELLWPSAPTRHSPYILRTLQHRDMENNVFCGLISYFSQDSIEERLHASVLIHFLNYPPDLSALLSRFAGSALVRQQRPPGSPTRRRS